MMADQDAELPVLAVTAAVGAVVLLLVLLFGIGKKEQKEENEPESENESKPKSNGKSQSQPKSKKEKPIAKKPAKSTFSHPWLATSLRFHSGKILGMDFSSNGKYLITCADDRSVLLWSVKEFSQKEHKAIRGNVALDHATQVKFSPDSKAFITSLYNENTVRIFKMAKKDTGSISIQAADDFPEKHSAQLTHIGISNTGRWIMTCYMDTTIKIWSLKGELLATIDTKLMNNSYGAASPCGRFVAASGFTPDVKVWEVVFGKTGDFKEVKRAFELKGHKAGIYSFDFSQGSDRMATVSKDGTWKVWNTKIEYEKNQDPNVLMTGQCDFSGPSLVALSADGRAVGIATGSNLALYNSTTGKCEQTFEDVFNGPVTSVSFDASGKYLCASGDKHVNVFHNIVGYNAIIQDCTEQRKKSHINEAYKERLQMQIDQAKAALASILK